jgi:hypothetical protein
MPVHRARLAAATATAALLSAAIPQISALEVRRSIHGSSLAFGMAGSTHALPTTAAAKMRSLACSSAGVAAAGGAQHKPEAGSRALKCRGSSLRLRMSGGSDVSQPPETPLVKFVAYLTSLFPFWVLGAGTLGFLKPAALGWLKGELVTFSLALTMLFMGMTLTFADFQRVLKNPKQART